MSFIKIGESIELDLDCVKDTNSVASVVDENILQNFAKVASNLKKIAPKANDFLYFSGVMMHASEAAAINNDGSPKLTKTGEPVKVGWDLSNNTYKWVTNDPNVKPYINQNRDTFPESELIKAHKKWIGKPLCLDHKSSSVDHTRGFIVDTYYDYKLKRVVALCALDKANYPDLAKKVSSMMQTALSMGTAVGKAICTDCGKVAKVESDFCNHMRYKTCHGEINIDLSPIELSLVVNPADTKAHIKHIIAAAKTLNNYVEQKNNQLEKMAGVFKANLSFDHSNGGDDRKSFDYSINTTDIESFKNDLEKVMKEYQEISSSIQNEEELSDSMHNDAYDHQTESSVDSAETDLGNTDFSLAPPVQRFASFNEEIKDVRLKLAEIHDNIVKMQENVQKISSIQNVTQEEMMSGSKNELNKKSYFQGGGGVNEPTPGKVKYPIDPMNEDLRESGDKHMVGAPPFPNVGPVDGLYPGVGDKSDLELKKMLSRAQAEERALKRAELLGKVKETLESKKVGYYMGGGGVNEPTPGKVKYSPDPMNEKLRKTDKHMVGQKPFPDVGDVEGLHPSPDSAELSDELKRKQLLSRAEKLKAKFVKAASNDGSLDLGNSSWEVFLGDKLLLTASVKELTGGRSERHYSAVATEECGKDLISRIRALGANEVKSALKKTAQDATPPAAPGAPPAPAMPSLDAAPPAAAPAAPVPEMPPALTDSKPAGDSGNEGDPKEVAVELSEKVRDLSSDLSEAVKALTGEQEEMGALDNVGTSASADDGVGVTTAALQSIRKELNPMLVVACQEAIEALARHENELNTIASMYEKGAVNEVNKEYVDSLVNDSFIEAQASIADGLNLLGGFVRYSRGTEAVIKRAAEEARMSKYAADEMDNDLMSLVRDDSSVEHEANELHEPYESHMSHEPHESHDKHSVERMLESDLPDDYEECGECGYDHGYDYDEAHWAHKGLDGGESELEETFDHDDELDSNDVVTVPNTDMAAEMTKKDPNAAVEVKSASSKEERAVLRAKLAADMKWSSMLEDAHKHVTGTEFDVKPSGNLGHVETVEEVHSAMMDLANAPPKVKKQAEMLNKLISEGSVKVADLPKLVSEGLDSDAVKYWKQFFGQAGSEGSEFATELVKEHVKAQYEEEKEEFRVKLARAYEMAYEMVDRGLITNDKGAIANQVDAIMKWNDESFNSVKKIVASYSSAKKTAMPQVGVMSAFDESANQTNEDMNSLLKQAFANSGKRLF